MRWFLLLPFFLLWNTNITAQTKEALRDSLAEASKALSLNPYSEDLRLRKAAWNMLLEQWEYAQGEYNYILKDNPKCIPALYYRAYSNEKLGRLSFAKNDYTQLLQIVPNHFEGLLGLSLLCQKEKHYTEAYDNINQLVSQYPDSAIAYAARAGIEMERQYYELAEYDYSEAIKRDGNNIDYLLNRVNARLLLRKKKEAKEDLDRLTKLGVPRANLKHLYKKCK